MLEAGVIYVDGPPTPTKPQPYQLLPPLSPEAYASLEASIREHGVEDPVLIDEQGQTLDGHNRREIAERLGLPCPTRVVAGLGTDGDKRIFAARRNLERRQLTKAQRTLVALRLEPELARQRGRPRSVEISPELDNLPDKLTAAARIAGLSRSTYNNYRQVVRDAQEELGKEEVERQVATGAWDITELREFTTGKRAGRSAAAAGLHGIARLLSTPEDARRGRGRPAPDPPPVDDGDGYWMCPACDRWWPGDYGACGPCGLPRDHARPDPPKQETQGAGANATAAAATAEPQRRKVKQRPPVPVVPVWHGVIPMVRCIGSAGDHLTQRLRSLGDEDRQSLLAYWRTPEGGNAQACARASRSALGEATLSLDKLLAEFDGIEPGKPPGAKSAAAAAAADA